MSARQAIKGVAGPLALIIRVRRVGMACNQLGLTGVAGRAPFRHDH